jgi:hypothetical protein
MTPGLTFCPSCWSPPQDWWEGDPVLDQGNPGLGSADLHAWSSAIMLSNLRKVKIVRNTGAKS